MPVTVPGPTRRTKPIIRAQNVVNEGTVKQHRNISNTTASDGGTVLIGSIDGSLLIE
jgi:hypothetical protein